MKLKKINNIQEYQTLVAQFGVKGCKSNDYLQQRASQLINAGSLYVYIGIANAYLFEQKYNCMRLYYYLNDLHENFNETLTVRLVTEILYRDKSVLPNEEISFLLSQGFEKNITRGQYAASYNDLCHQLYTTATANIDFARSLEEVTWACTFFNNIFDISGDHISQNEYESLLTNRQILIARDSNGTRVGALHQKIERKTAWISHVAVSPNVRGQGVGKSLVSRFIEVNHSELNCRYMLWVQRQNKSAIKLYENLGFKKTNKSTLSMIK